MSLLFTSGGQSIRASASSSSPSNEYSGLISFRIDWFHLLAVWRTLRSLLQHHDSKALILQHSAVLIFQPSHPYMTTRKTLVLTIWTFASKVMSLLSFFLFFFNLNLFILIGGWLLYNIVLVLPYMAINFNLNINIYNLHLSLYLSLSYIYIHIYTIGIYILLTWQILLVFYYKLQMEIKNSTFRVKWSWSWILVPSFTKVSSLSSGCLSVETMMQSLWDCYGDYVW